MRRAALALVALASVAGCGSGGVAKPTPAPSPSPTVADPFTPASRADLLARINAELPAIKDVQPDQTDAYYALSTACLHLSRIEKATTADVAARIGVSADVRADLHAAADACGTDPAIARQALGRVTAALTSP